VTTKQLFTSEVFTQEVLEKMNPIVNDYFKFKSLEEIEETEKKFIEIVGSDEEDDRNIESIDAGDFFN
jgi:hypothetical protein